MYNMRMLAHWCNVGVHILRNSHQTFSKSMQSITIQSEILQLFSF